MLTSAQAWPPLTSRAATLMLASLRPRTSLACSSMPITSGASTTSSGKVGRAGKFAEFGVQLDLVTDQHRR